RKVALLWVRSRGLVPWMPLIDRVAERIRAYESFLILPVLVIRTAEQNANPQIDVHETVRDQLAVYNDAGRDEHCPAPVGHVLVAIVANLRILEGPPTAEEDA